MTAMVSSLIFHLSAGREARGQSGGTIPAPSRLLAWDCDIKESMLTNGEGNARFEFSVTNLSPTNVIITGTRSACGCTEVRLPSTPWVLGPGASGTMAVTLDVSNQTGTIVKSVEIDVLSHGTEYVLVKAIIPFKPFSPDKKRAPAPARLVSAPSCAKCHLGSDPVGDYEVKCLACHGGNARTLKSPPGRDAWAAPLKDR